MTKKTLAALKDSIEHWTRLATGKTRPSEGVGPSHCALCRMFLLDPNWCKGCPVMKRTGRPTCEGTPYRKADALWHDDKAGPTSKKFKAAAKKELKFLKTLLPK